MPSHHQQASNGQNSRVFLSIYGFKMLKNSGSRRKFHHAERDVLIICHEPHPSPEVDRGCIVDVAETLKANGFVEN